MPLVCRFSALYPAAFLWPLVVRGDRPFQSPGICLFCIGALLSPTVAQIALCDKEPVVHYLSCHYTCANYKKQKIICEPDGQSPILCQNDTVCSESKCRPVKCEVGGNPTCDATDVPLCVGNTDDQVKRKHVFFTKGPRKYGFEFRFERIRSFLIGAAVLLAIPLFLFFVHWFIHSDHPLTRYVLRYNEERRRLGLSRESGYHATRASSNDLRDSFTRTAYHDECYPYDHERHGHTIRHNRSQSERRNSSRSHGGHRHHNSASSLSRNASGNSQSNNNRHHHRTRSTHSCRHYRRSPEHTTRNLGRENEGYSASNPSVNYNERNGRSWALQVPVDDTTDRRHSSPRLEGHRVHWYAADNDPFTRLILDSDERLNNNGTTNYGTISPHRRNYVRITNNPLHVPSSDIRVDLPPSYSETMGMDEPPPTYCEVMANAPQRM